MTQTDHATLRRASAAAARLVRELQQANVPVRVVLSADAVGLIVPPGAVTDLPTATPGWCGISTLPVHVLEF